MDSGESSDAPEEFTSEQGLKQDQEIKKILWENKTRVAREGKERRRKWAHRKTPQQAGQKAAEEVSEPEGQVEEPKKHEDMHGMLPKHIIDIIAAREKQTFHTDSDDEVTDKKPAVKKKFKKSGSEPVVLNEIPPPQCLHNSMAFLKQRKMKVSRSHSVLKNSRQALRLLSSTGILS